MTKKDYFVLVRAIGGAVKSLAEAKHSKLENYQLAVLLDNICWELQRDNPRFSPTKFKTAFDKYVFPL